MQKPEGTKPRQNGAELSGRQTVAEFQKELREAGVGSDKQTSTRGNGRAQKDDDNPRLPSGLEPAVLKNPKSSETTPFIADGLQSDTPQAQTLIYRGDDGKGSGSNRSGDHPTKPLVDVVLGGGKNTSGDVLPSKTEADLRAFIATNLKDGTPRTNSSDGLDKPLRDAVSQLNQKPAQPSSFSYPQTEVIRQLLAKLPLDAATPPINPSPDQGQRSREGSVSDNKVRAGSTIALEIQVPPGLQLGDRFLPKDKPADANGRGGDQWDGRKGATQGFPNFPVNILNRLSISPEGVRDYLNQVSSGELRRPQSGAPVVVSGILIGDGNIGSGQRQPGRSEQGIPVDIIRNNSGRLGDLPTKVLEAAGLYQLTKELTSGLAEAVQRMPKAVGAVVETVRAQMVMMTALLSTFADAMGRATPAQLAGIMGQLERAMAGLKGSLAEALNTIADKLGSKQMANLAAALGDSSAGQQLALARSGKMDAGSLIRGDVPMSGEASTRRDSAAQTGRDGATVASQPRDVSAQAGGRGEAASTGRQNASDDARAPLMNFRANNAAQNTAAERAPMPNQASSSVDVPKASPQAVATALREQAGAERGVASSASNTATTAPNTTAASAQTPAAAPANAAPAQDALKNLSPQAAPDLNKLLDVDAGQSRTLPKNDPATDKTPAQREAQPQMQTQQAQLDQNDQKQSQPPSENRDGIYYVQEEGITMLEVALDCYRELTSIHAAVADRCSRNLSDYNGAPHHDADPIASELFVGQGVTIPSHNRMFELMRASIESGVLEARYLSPIRDALGVRASAQLMREPEMA